MAATAHIHSVFQSTLTIIVFMQEQTARDELAMIRSLMQDSQRIVHENGAHYLGWGVLSAAALLLTYAAAASRLDSIIPWIWVVAIGAGWVFSLWIARRSRRTARVRTLAGRLLGAIWMGCGITLTLFGFIGGATGAIPWGSLQGVLAGILGIGYFASSFVYDSAAWRYLAAGWWAGAALMLLWPGPHTLLLLAALVVALEIVPGALLYARSRRETALAAG